MTTAGTVDVNGTTLHFEEAGEGESILFIHGMCGDADTWADQMARLSLSYHCIAYDRRGHTRSPLGQITGRSVELHADDAAGLIGALGLAPCIVVGSSSGGRIALDVIRRYPELVKGAVLSEPPLLSLDRSASDAFIGKVKSSVERAVERGGPRAAVDAFFELVCPGYWPSLSETRRDVFRSNVDELFGDLTMPPYEVTRADLARIQVPCLVISGGESDGMMRSIAAILAEEIPGARLLELADTGHVTYAENPEAFAAAVNEFAGQL